jgi:hypothetical protein
MDGFMESAIPVIAIVLSIGGPLAIAALVIHSSHRKDMALQEMVASAVASGKSPEEIREIIGIVNPRRQGNRLGTLKAGVLLIGMAAAMAFTALVLGHTAMLEPGAYLFFGGVALVLIWRVTDRKVDRS